ncbi:MAG: NTP transferase domain-containing protein [Chloroflexi bacterium]|nr:NTP transferase domain-containing protein [Chloroflexota bacterium]
MAKRIRKAVIPTAGLGTRFLPVTRSVPKALLPVLQKPLIHYAIEEAAAAGIEEVIVVVNPGSESIAGYFDPQPELERMLKLRGRAAELEQQIAITKIARVHAVPQHEARGLGDAVLMAQDYVKDEAFAVLLPDDVIWAQRPAIGQLIDVWDRHGGSVVAAKEVPDEAVEKLGIIAGKLVSGPVWNVTGLVEKPKLADAPSHMAIIGRYILSPAVFDYLKEGRRGAGGEIQLTDAIASRLNIEPVHACVFEGAHVDAGTPQGMLAAAIFQARKQPGYFETARAMVEAAETGTAVRTGA